MTHILAVLPHRSRLAVTPASSAPAFSAATIAEIVARNRLLANFAAPAPVREANFS